MDSASLFSTNPPPSARRSPLLPELPRAVLALPVLSEVEPVAELDLLHPLPLALRPLLLPVDRDLQSTLLLELEDLSLPPLPLLLPRLRLVLDLS